MIKYEDACVYCKAPADAECSMECPIFEDRCEWCDSPARNECRQGCECDACSPCGICNYAPCACDYLYDTWKDSQLD